jgi:hypothetical protein
MASGRLLLPSSSVLRYVRSRSIECRAFLFVVGCSSGALEVVERFGDAAELFGTRSRRRSFSIFSTALAILSCASSLSSLATTAKGSCQSRALMSCTLHASCKPGCTMAWRESRRGNCWWIKAVPAAAISNHRNPLLAKPCPTGCLSSAILAPGVYRALVKLGCAFFKYRWLLLGERVVESLDSHGDQ